MHSPPLLLFITIGALALGACLILGTRSGKPHNRTALAVVLLHPVTTIGLFYSLAIHLHARLGGWPRAIGDQDFPQALAVHADVALSTFGALLLALILCPIIMLLGACLHQVRPGLRYLGLYALTGGVALGATMLAPAPFLYWWWD
jgi:hypothetical protein